jgi:uncharacterized protein
VNKIIVTGGTGFIGGNLLDRLLAENYEITLFTRNPGNYNNLYPPQVKLIRWDYHSPGIWENELVTSNIVIHLASANLFGKRWSEKYKKKIIESREESTRSISEVILRSTDIKLFITASAIGFYGDTGNNVADENSSGTKDDFLAEVTERWEKPSYEVDKKGIRRINMRTGLVMSTKEGYLSKLLLPYSLFVGGPLGSKENWMSWVHIDDVINAYLFVIKNPGITGPVNVTSPNPVTMGEFSSTLGKIMNRPSFFRVPKTAIKIMVGEFGEYIAYSQRVVPQKLKSCGFQFRFPDLKTALNDLVKNQK